jgi:hypothetical protein
MPVWTQARYDRLFISYGGPDEEFASRLYEALTPDVETYFFKETAPLGARIDEEVYSKLQEHDRVLLLCSRGSLNRPGVINEIKETLARESRDGGATYLIPVMLDDYLFDENGWVLEQPYLTKRLLGRFVGDFRQARHSEEGFDKAVERLRDRLIKV